MIVFLAFLLSCEIKQPIDTKNESLTFNGISVTYDDLKSSIQEVKSQEVRRMAEKHFHRISDEVPGFGGYFIDKNGNYTMYLTENSPRGISKTLAAKEIRHTNRNFDGSNFIIKDGLFGFSELSKWRELVSAFVLGNDMFDFVLSSYVNETINRISVGIKESKFTEERINTVIEFIVQYLEIPVEAIEFEKTTPISLESFPNLSGSLGSYNRPLVGGITLRYTNQAHPGCTIGFSGILDGKEVVITNSHCTQVTFGTSSHLTFFQPTHGIAANIIGVEYKDPNTSWCGLSNPFHNCRYSDAAAIEINSNVDIGLGLIARTNSFSSDFTPGSVQIDTNNPVFSIALSVRDHFLKVGDFVHKVGRAGGVDIWKYYKNMC